MIDTWISKEFIRQIEEVKKSIDAFVDNETDPHTKERLSSASYSLEEAKAIFEELMKESEQITGE